MPNPLTPLDKDASGNAEGQGEGSAEWTEIQNNEIKKVILEMRQEERMWNAPLPPPDVFNLYPESVQKKIVEVMEKENQHRYEITRLAEQAMLNDHTITKAITDAEIEQAKRGQNYTFFIVLIVVLSTGFLLFSGRESGVILMVGIIPAIEPILRRILNAFNKEK